MAAYFACIIFAVIVLFAFGPESLFEDPVTPMDMIAYGLLTLDALAYMAAIMVPYGLMLPAIAIVYLRVAREQMLKFSDIYVIREQFWTCIGSYALLALVSLILSAPMIALVFATNYANPHTGPEPAVFVVMGGCALVQWTAMLMMVFAPMLIVDKRVGAVDSIVASVSLVARHFGKVLTLTVAVFGLNILGVLTLGFGMLATLPMSYMAFVLLYDRIAEPGHAYLVEDEFDEGDLDDVFL